MPAETQTLIGLLLILALGLVAPEVSRRTLHLPFVTSIILIGALFGPHGFDWLQTSETIEFFGFLGFTFLMLLAGLETKITSVKAEFGRISVLALFNGGIPFLTGLGIGYAFGYSWIASLLIGTIFVSSSVAIIIPFLQARETGQTMQSVMLPAFILQDVVSVVLLTSILQFVAPVTSLPLSQYFGILAFSVAALFFVIPRLSKMYLTDHRFFSHNASNEDHLRFVLVLLISVLRFFSHNASNEDHLRFVLVLLISVLLYFSLIGVHPILAAFLVGILIGEIVQPDTVHKIHTLGYGLFVPVFFFLVGMEMDLAIFMEFDTRNLLIITVVFGLLLSKFGSGFLAGKLVRLNTNASTIFGTVSVAQLTTTLAATYAAANLGIFDAPLITAVVTIAVVTNLLVPVCLQFLTEGKKLPLLPWRRRKEKKEALKQTGNLLGT